MRSDTTRRTVLATGTAALALGAAGCGTGKSGGDASASQAADASAPASASSPAPVSSSPAAAGGQALAATSEIPEGGGKVFKEQKVVVTQPAKGQFKAFSATCTHQGCTVAEVADGAIVCPCHGSRFDISDGSVSHGPATRPLDTESIMVMGNSIHLS
ncbi:Rieske (2Fe-2S) protein [Streptomyces sp. LP11]|uniref:Cytochrome bc1 complex Rieske iron-sulfur subunit n=1 Tax=Streptomyces pyxinicus TaxID=2970331 RepID=A0ABT2B0M7_9ACTN|nr:Rieske (2Fe-2S) protein [Streptomyces sp. LP11]MCS0602079.1 Rieske (2Fe-2S) protein [Streptomyces sp. LP11]